MCWEAKEWRTITMPSLSLYVKISSRTDETSALLVGSTVNAIEVVSKSQGKSAVWNSSAPAKNCHVRGCSTKLTRVLEEQSILHKGKLNSGRN